MGAAAESTGPNWKVIGPVAAVVGLLIIGGIAFALTSGGDDGGDDGVSILADRNGDDDTADDDSSTDTTADDSSSSSDDDSSSSDDSATSGDLPAAGAPASSISDYGTDSELDDLADACEDGDMQACDDLFFGSPVDSGYEAYGDSCGERNEPGATCVSIYESDTSGGPAPDATPPAQAIPEYGSDAALDALADACAADDYQACDDLFFDAESGSQQGYKDYGDSCGERNEPAGFCDTIYG